MHRHGYQGRKFGRETDQRQALLKGLAVQLIEHGKIETTLPKAKDLRPFTESLITKAKKGDLHSRRQIISSLSSATAAEKLVNQIAPLLSGRNSGYLRIKSTSLRVGDNAQLATISFVDDITKKPTPAPAKPAAKKAAKPAAKPTGAKKPTVKKAK